MKKVRTFFNYNETQPVTPETANLPSKTVPDQTLSLKELIARHAQGRDITTLTPIYQETGDYSELATAIDGMSEMEQLEYLKTLKVEVRQGLEAYEADEKDRKQRFKKQQEDAIAAKIAEAQAKFEGNYDGGEKNK